MGAKSEIEESGLPERDRAQQIDETMWQTLLQRLARCRKASCANLWVPTPRWSRVCPGFLNHLAIPAAIGHSYVLFRGNCQPAASILSKTRLMPEQLERCPSYLSKAIED